MSVRWGMPSTAGIGRVVASAIRGSSAPPVDGPLRGSGVRGFRDRPGPDTVPADSLVRRRALFGLTPAGV